MNNASKSEHAELGTDRPRTCRQRTLKVLEIPLGFGVISVNHEVLKMP
jgi:hypothetical protein